MKSVPFMPDRSIVTAVCVLIAAGCGGAHTASPPLPPAPVIEAPAPSRPAALTEAEIRAIAELMLLEDRRTLDVTRVAELLAHWSPEVRRRAAWAAGRIRDRRATPLLIAALEDSVASVRADVAFALGTLGDTSIVVTRALEARLSSDDDLLAAESAGSLARLATPASFDVLTRLLAAPGNRPGAAHREALLGLFRFRQAAVATNLLAPYLEHADREVRWRATWVIARTGVAIGVPHLLRRAQDADPLVRSLAVRGLRAALADTVGQRAAAHAALLAAIADGEPHVRIHALSALGTYGPAAAEAIAPLLRDGDGNVRMAAVLALGATGSGAAVPTLAATVADPAERFGVRAAALNTLATLDAPVATEAAKRWATSPQWVERMMAARVLGAAAWDQARSTLRDLAGDADARVARAAITGVARFADTTADAYAYYLERLRATDPRIRAAAIAGIARRARAENFAVLMDAYEAAQQDSVADAALAAVDGLAGLRRQGTPVEAAFFTRFRPPRDPELRQRIERRLGAAWPGPATPPVTRGAAFYEDVVRRLVAPAIAGNAPPQLRIVTERGDIAIDLAPAEAPLTVHNIIALVERGYFDAGADADARRWHRVVPNFVLQDGEPRGDGSGNPGYSIRDEINRIRYGRGVLGMALSGPDTGGSQFFITHSPQPHLDGGYTIFGTVTAGMDVADRVVQDDRILRMEIVRR